MGTMYEGATDESELIHKICLFHSYFLSVSDCSEEMQQKLEYGITPEEIQSSLWVWTFNKVLLV